MDMIMEASECILLKHHRDEDDDDQPPSSSLKLSEEKKEEDPINKGTLMLDTICALSNIRYPQDFSLLNEAREKLESIIDRFSKSYGLKKPSTYRREARKNYLSLAKSKNVALKRFVKPYASS